MNAQETFQTIAKGRVIAILRGDFGGRETDMVEAMIYGGLTAVEVTLNSPNALEKINKLAKRFGSRCAVGAGTVLIPHEVQQIADAGGTFIVSPNTDSRVITETKFRSLISFPGAFTPTEVVAAVNAGADAVKLFPANTLGVTYVKALRAPLNDIKLVPTGGVTPELAREYKQAGAWGVGIGSELIGKEILADETFQNLRHRTIEFIDAMKNQKSDE